MLIGKQCEGKDACRRNVLGIRGDFWVGPGARPFPKPLPKAVAKEVIGLSAAVVKSSRLQLAVRVVDGDAESSEEGLRAHGRGTKSPREGD